MNRIVLWDLDGTLVRLHRPLFRSLMPLVAAASFRPLVPPVRFLSVLGTALPAARVNDTDLTNVDRLVDLVAQGCGLERDAAASALRRVADEGFPRLRSCFAPQPAARSLVADLSARGHRQVVATNPMWPASTVHARLRWGGLDPATFEFVTCGETMTRSKPNPEYYRQVLARLGADPGDCVMIGDDVANDTPAAGLGIPVFLVLPARGAERRAATEYRNHHPHHPVTVGDWSQLRDWLESQEAPCSSS